MRVCSIEICERKHLARGYCYKHYHQFRREGSLQATPVIRRGPVCVIEGCEGEHVANGLCRNHYQQQWRKQNPPSREEREKTREYLKQWKLANPEYERNYARARWANNKEQERARSRSWREQNSEKLRESKRRYRETHRDEIRAKNLAYLARKREATILPFTQTQLEARLSMFGGRCGLCHEEILPDQQIHIDHRVPLSRGGPHILSNLQPTHAACNIRKGNRYVA